MTHPQRIGKYEIVEVIGRGGYATVHRALHSTLKSEVALEVLEPARAEACQLQAAYCSHQPILALEIKVGTLQEKQWSKVQFIVRNIGYGLAQDIILHHDEHEQFEGDLEESREIFALKPGVERNDWVGLCPNAHGERVPV